MCNTAIVSTAVLVWRDFFEGMEPNIEVQLVLKCINDKFFASFKNWGAYTLIDTFEIELVLQNRNTKDFDTFNLHAQEKLKEIYRRKLK